MKLVLRSLVILLGIAHLGLTTTAEPPKNEKPVQWNNPAGAPAGSEHGSFKSDAVGQEVGYNVVLPAGYSTAQQRYPVIYFLHGWGGDENSDGPRFAAIVAEMVQAGKIPPVICVFPNGGRTGYRDRPQTAERGESLIIRELLPRIDAQYRTINGAEGRVITGFSMGGGGAVRLALKHPELFSAAAGWAAAFRDATADADDELGVSHLTALRGRVRLLLIVGGNDLTYPWHAAVLQNLEKAHYPYDFRLMGGVDHNLDVYMRRTGEEMVQFLCAGFTAAAAK